MSNRTKKIFIPILLLIIIVGIIIINIDEEPRPVIPHPPVISAIPVQIIDEGDNFPVLDLNKFVDDTDNNVASIRWSCTGGTHLTIQLDDNLLSAKQPNEDWYGSDTITVTASDPGKLSTETEIVFVVKPVDDPPMISTIPEQTIEEGGTFTPIQLNNFVSDIDNTPGEISWAVLGQTLVDVIINKRNIAYVKTKDENIYGIDTLLFIATDPEHLAATKRVIFNITPVNDPPIVRRIVLPAINEGESFPVINLEEYGDDIDTQKDKLKFSVTGEKFLSILIDKKNRLTITTPHPDWFGEDTLFYSLSDSTYAVGTCIIATILPVNDKPVITQIPSQTIKEEDIFRPLILNNFADDIDNTDDELRWNFSGNTIVDITIDDNNVLNAHPRYNQFGSDTVTISVMDPEGLQAAAKVIFKVIEKTLWERAPFKEIRTVAYTAVDDLLALAVSPYYWNGYDYLKFGIFTTTTAAFIAIDKNIQTEVMSDRRYGNSDLLRFGECYGRNITSIGASIGFFGVGAITGKSELAQIGLEIFESYVIVNEFTAFLKNAFGRERPYNGTEATNFYIFEKKEADFYSLPSGHTALAFSLSSVMAAHTDNIILKSIIFTPAIVTAIERVYNNRHWVSDVILGGAIGYYIGNYIVNRHLKNEDSNFNLSVNPLGEIGLSYKFD